MRLFGGMEQDQIARVLGVTRMTIHRDWLVARAWLAGRMRDDLDG
jgi:DNA-binding transcriptional regulator LsrR (DeoR family)